MTKYKNKFDYLISVFKALSDPNRLRALLVLQDRELCVCQIVEMLGFAPSTVSKHMSILKNAGLVETEKKGRWVHYRKADTGNPVIEQLLQSLPELLRQEDQVQNDDIALSRIMALDPETLCKMQNKRNDHENTAVENSICCSDN